MTITMIFNDDSLRDLMESIIHFQRRFIFEDLPLISLNATESEIASEFKCMF